MIGEEWIFRHHGVPPALPEEASRLHMGYGELSDLVKFVEDFMAPDYKGTDLHGDANHLVCLVRAYSIGIFWRNLQETKQEVLDRMTK